jgi:peptide deformylase
MAILKIARMGHPALGKAAEPIEDPTAPEIKNLVNDMIETLHEAGGVGLAATQVHVLKRLVIFHIPPHRAGSEEAGVPLRVLINPRIEPLDDEVVTQWESCLSLPGLSGVVPRFLRVRYHGVDLQGEPIERIAEGFHARVVQHECDHLDGILYPMRMTDMSLFGFVDDMKWAMEEDKLAEQSS